MKLVIGLFLLLLIIAVGGKFAMDYYQGNGFSLPFLSQSGKATVNNQVFKLYLANTDNTRQVGLSDKTEMPQDYGMLFEFEKADYHTFWMKNMKFPIDILFLKDDKVVTVYKNAQVPKEGDSLSLYKPEEPANKVLEINAGLSEKYNIKKGDTVKIEK